MQSSSKDNWTSSYAGPVEKIKMCCADIITIIKAAGIEGACIVYCSKNSSDCTVISTRNKAGEE